MTSISSPGSSNRSTSSRRRRATSAPRSGRTLRNQLGRGRSRSRSPSRSFPSYPFSSTSVAEAPSSASNTGSVLRRERFLFDDVLAGPYALRDLTAAVRTRCRKAMQVGDDMVLLCLACGEKPSLSSSTMENGLDVEPSVALLLGSGGGSGLLHTVVTEILRFIGKEDGMLVRNSETLCTLSYIFVYLLTGLRHRQAIFDS